VNACEETSDHVIRDTRDIKSQEGKHKSGPELSLLFTDEFSLLIKHSCFAIRTYSSELYGNVVLLILPNTNNFERFYISTLVPVSCKTGYPKKNLSFHSTFRLNGQKAANALYLKN